MLSIFDGKSEDLFHTIKKAILNDSLADDFELQKRLEDAIMKMKLMDYAINETMIVAVTNKAGQILYVNDRFVQISGFKKEELIGKTHKVVNSKVHPASFFKSMWSTLLRGEIWTGEICNKRKNGELYWVKTYILPVKTNDNASYFLSIRTDITAEKENELLLQSNILSSFETVVHHVNNLVFKVEQDASGCFGFSLFTGKLAADYFRKRGLETIQPSGNAIKSIVQPFHSIDSYFNQEMSERLHEKLKEVCIGEEVSYKEWFDDKCIHITISPLIKNGRITGAIGFGNDITELECTRKKLAELAYRDHLTNTYNTAALERDVQEKIVAESPFSFLYIDLDRFKNINDSLGHVTGDELLKKVTERMKRYYVNVGELYRIGGDEFVVLIDGDIAKNSSLVRAEDLIQLMEQPFFIDEMELYISCSIGVSYYPMHGSTYRSLHRSADLALNISKESGKGKAILFDQTHKDGFVNKVRLESDIRYAIENKEFFLVYQPKVNLKTESIYGYEALIRWNKKEEGIIQPNDFIPFAEETGLIISIGKYVLKEACKQAVEWLEMGVSFQTISVNISPAELEQNDFFHHLQTVLSETGLPPHYLEIEITENVLMKNMEKLARLLRDLKHIGIKLAMDDFGSGFSNFRYLSDLPIHTLKLDRVFMNRVLEDREGVIVSSIIRIGHSLGLEVVAEGVETAEVIDFLKLHDCHSVQGYYYSKPIEASEVPSFKLASFLG
ncbi:EAL domain-containing protein [Bacillus sp. FJAT-22090]|uniref:sensor domain-containing protein n=1 Tax=Bacillus sp. FJAT-22090 TaxID=1581038 RepID=UPI0016425733|nr:EAL domain-containing protein [Bacillus sp. FJAT-22090]